MVTMVARVRRRWWHSIYQEIHVDLNLKNFFHLWFLSSHSKRSVHRSPTYSFFKTFCYQVTANLPPAQRSPMDARKVLEAQYHVHAPWQGLPPLFPPLFGLDTRGDMTILCRRGDTSRTSEGALDNCTDINCGSSHRVHIISHHTSTSV